jgi:hypothetical protein
VRRHVLNAESYQIASAELAVDSQVEEGVRIAQTCFGWRGGFAPTSLPLFRGSFGKPVAAEF